MKAEAQRFGWKYPMGMTGSPIGLAAALGAVLLLSAASNAPARADMTVVQQDKTPIVSWPGVGGRILTRVDAGFPLTVLGRDGEWLKVASPDLNLTGELWVPAARVGDIAGAPLELAPPETASATAIVPQFRITTNTAGGMAATTFGTPAAAAPRDTTNGAAGAVTRSASSKSAGSTVRATASSTPSGNPTPAADGSSTAAPDNSVSSPGDPTPAVSGNPTPAVGNATPALGNPTPAVSNNPTPALGNSTPAMGNSVVSFGN